MEESQLLARIDERQKSMDEKLDRVMVQTTLTNGRVTKLEAFRSWFLGVVAMGGVIIAIAEIIVQIKR